MPQEIFTTSLINDANLQAYFRMENNTNDSGPNGYNLAQSGSPTFEAGQFGNAIKLVAGSSQYASIVNASCPNLNITGNLTVYAWVKRGSVVVANYQILSKKNHLNAGYQLYIDGSNILHFSCSGHASAVDVASNHVFNETTTLHQVVGVYDGVKLYLYVDGALDNSAASTGSTDTNTIPFAVGAAFDQNSDAVGEFWTGDIDDTAVFNRALSGADIAALFNGTYGIPAQQARSSAIFL